jgi:CHAT domain-containing protein
MKPLSRLVIALCICVTFCNGPDTKRAELWVSRSVEPRLSNVADWRPCGNRTLAPGNVVEQVPCASQPRIAANLTCPESVLSRTDALSILTSRPRCTDAAVHALERFARTDVLAMSDVGAAYYIRAQRDDRASDLLRALDAADQAVAAQPQSPAAHFNRSLALEALGLRDETIASWKKLSTGNSGWAKEAQRHEKQLSERVDDATRWAADRDALSSALRAHDRAAVARLIEPLPGAAQQYFEEELLQQWARNPTPQALEELSLFASELSRLSGDQFPIEIVAAIQQASPERLQLIRQGHLECAEGYRYERLLQFGNAASHYKPAVDLLARGGSAFRLRAEMGVATALSFVPNRRAEALLRIPMIANEANQQRYRHLGARIQWLRAYVMDRSDYLGSLEAYQASLVAFARLRDMDRVVGAHTRLAGLLRIVGHNELAWREALYAYRHRSRLLNPKHRQVLTFEIADTALALGHARIALLYHEQDVRDLKKELVATPPENIAHLNSVQQALALALSHRAEVQLALGRSDDARRDFDEATRLETRVANPDPNTRRIVAARANELRAQALLASKPEQAIVAIDAALSDNDPSFSTRLAQLHAKRAEANLRLGRDAMAESDLRTAITILHQEESSLLANRRPGEGEAWWGSYFARFQETHRLLVRQLMTHGKPATAFVFTERSRAVEPLDLLKKRASMTRTPSALEAEIPRESDALEVVRSIQRALPEGTYLIEYSVGRDMAYAWILSRDAFEPLPLPGVDRETTERWSVELQAAASSREGGSIANGVLHAAYQGLAAKPLAVIERVSRGKNPARLVFVPDGALHGFPLHALQNPANGLPLVARFPIEFSGSTELYLFSLERDRVLPTGRGSLLAIGDPAFDRQMPLAQGFKRLPHAASEAKRVAAEAPGGAVLLEEQATAPAFLSRARSNDIIHIAAHTIINPEWPSRSFVLLAPSAGHSGVLDAEQMLTGLTLDRTRLVILSSCKSAGGLPIGPEGVAPFVRSLTAAGVPAVIGSLWEVEDNTTTEELMVSFHRRYENGSDAAEAMRAAQLELLAKNNNIFAWAPFQVIGHASSPGARAPSGGNTRGIHSSNSLQRLDRIRSQ